MKTVFICAVSMSGWLTLGACAQTGHGVDTLRADSSYVYRASSDDGTGKYYFGREIAPVMGHLGAEWLERPAREQEERTDWLVKALALQPTDVIADVGAGTGYFSFRLAEAVPQGKVWAVDVQPEMITLLHKNKQRLLGTQPAAAVVAPLLSTITDPKLPANKLDLVLLVDAYHEFSHPREMVMHLVRALKPNGRIALVEYRAEDPSVAIKPLHKMSEAQARKEMSAAGLVFVNTNDLLPQQHLMFFKKP